jgi:hypothetical protein
MTKVNFDLTIAVPAYGRVHELRQLIESVEKQAIMPRELLVCEDMSPERPLISALCMQWSSILKKKGCILKYVENTTNLGYDGNVRKLFEESSCTWVMLIGNDDVLLPQCAQTIQNYLVKFPNVLCASRTFLRFENFPENILGISKIFDSDTLITHSTHTSNLIFRSCGFVGGLVFNKDWAVSKTTKIYDGSLYYQIYLACEAYCERGIDYIATPIVAGRSGNPPLFGSASAENSVHVPGSYTTQGRTKMWNSVLEISINVGQKHSLDLVTNIRKELAGRQSFHIFEMFAGQDIAKNRQLRNSLKSIGLFFGVMPRLLFLCNILLGKYSFYFYKKVRQMMQ